eukprot:TRINITY_DN16135_c0_g1_i1.p1 TRINITY_DN16135_c0_g1~~TRINITY_DN16135_c0_g1_i1.p1  ORF type:complete len:568 (-),score=129.14 TRINITY_DN16135_c0_g1_i1:187-1890(-)
MGIRQFGALRRRGLLVLAQYVVAAAVQWGNPSCWEGERSYERCCFPSPRHLYVENVQDVIRDDGNLHCWKKKHGNGGFNHSRCCLPNGRFFRGPGPAASEAVEKIFRGCYSYRWQSFLFKFKLTGGVLTGICASIDCFWEYWELPLSVDQWEDCKLGKVLFTLTLEHTNTREKFTYDSPKIGEKMQEAFTDLLYFDAEIAAERGANVGPLVDSASDYLSFANKAAGKRKSSPSLFHMVGTTASQQRQLAFLHGARLGDPTEPPGKPLTLALQQQVSTGQLECRRGIIGEPEKQLVLDFGMSGGIDAEYYLYLGHRVFGVEALPQNVRAVSRRLQTFMQRGCLKVMQAAVGKEDGGVVEFFQDMHQGEASGLERPDEELMKEYRRFLIPQTSCGAIYANATESLHEGRFGGPQDGSTTLRARSALYAKIDIEGQDLVCLESLLNGQGSFTLPPPPRYVSIELGDYKVLKMPHTDKLAKEVLRITGGRYCYAKLCKQHVYNMQKVIDPRGILLPLNRFGLGSSGLFGEHALDWRFGEAWRPLPEVLKEIHLAVEGVSGEWLDLHLKRCD